MVELKGFFGFSGIIALRKTGYFEKIWEKFSASMPEHMDEREFKGDLQKIIADLDNELFISESEKANKKIDPKLSLGDLKLDGNRILNRIGIALRHCEYKLDDE